MFNTRCSTTGSRLPIAVMHDAKSYLRFTLATTPHKFILVIGDYKNVHFNKFSADLLTQIRIFTKE